jgi:DNA-binding NarL/FixJ family response regulator
MVTHTISFPEQADRSWPPRVAIVDADRRIRRSLGNLLSLAGLTVVGQAGTVEEALDLVETQRPTVILIDTRLPDVEAGEALATAIVARHPEIKVVLMGWSDRPEPGARLAGFAGYLRKDLSPEEFVAAATMAARSGATRRRSRRRPRQPGAGGTVARPRWR